MTLVLTERQQTLISELNQLLECEAKHLFMVHVAHTQKTHGRRYALLVFMAKCLQQELVYIALLKSEVKDAYETVLAILKLLYPNESDIELSQDEEKSHYRIKLMQRTYHFMYWKDLSKSPFLKKKSSPVLHIMDTDYYHFLDPIFDTETRVIWWTRNEVILSAKWQKDRINVDKAIEAVVYEQSLSYDGRFDDLIFV